MCSFPDSTTENAPVAPKIPVPVSTVPVMFRISSLCHWPAPSSIPGVQFRKNLRHPQKPNSGRWLGRGKRFFRNWGQDGAAGGYSPAGLPEISGGFGDGWTNGSYRASGAFNRSAYAGGSNAANGGNGVTNVWNFLASRSNPIYGRSDTVTPANISQPVILYLGRPAQV